MTCANMKVVEITYRHEVRDAPARPRALDARADSPLHRFEHRGKLRSHLKIEVGRHGAVMRGRRVQLIEAAILKDC